ncbi:hypothetical protein GCM10020000_24770 [Streptomyces olivoverticillatus]
MRAVLAATLSPSWGVYAGYELCENTPVHAQSEEYLDSEKYQLRPRDWESAEREGRTIAPLITALNRLRRRQPALRLLRNLRFHHTDNEAVIAYSKRSGPSCVLTVVNLDPPPHPGGDGLVGHAGARPRLARVRPGARRAHRRDLSLGQGQLCAPGAGPFHGARARVLAATVLTDRRVTHTMIVNEPVPDTFEDTPPPRTWIPTGSSARCSTKCSYAPSRTATATASATSRG